MEQDYLDFDELITFLDQKGYKWNARRTIDLLLGAITDSKLTPVFFYQGKITATYAKFIGEKKWEEVKKDTCRLQGYFSANAYDLVDLYQDYFTCVPNCLILNGQHVRPYKIFGNPAPVATDHQKRTEGIDTCFLHLSCGSFVEGYGHTVSEFLYPVEQLDNMFNRDQPAIRIDEGIQQITNDYEKALERIEAKDQPGDSFKIGNPTVAHNEPKTIEQFKNALAAANAKIADLDSQLEKANAAMAGKPAPLHPRTANNASKIIAALTSELLNMDLTQPFANDSNGKIMAAIEKQGNAVSKDVIADWLKLAHKNSI